MHRSPGVDASPLVVLYDGSCGLCHKGVRYAQRRGRPGAYRFLAIEQPEAQALLASFGLADEAQDTMVAIEGGRAFVRSSATVRIACRFRWPHRWHMLLWLVPRPVRDAAYRFVARRRRHVCVLSGEP